MRVRGPAAKTGSGTTGTGGRASTNTNRVSYVRQLGVSSPEDWIDGLRRSCQIASSRTPHSIVDCPAIMRGQTCTAIQAMELLGTSTNIRSKHQGES